MAEPKKESGIFSKLFKKTDNKRTTENLILVGILGIILIIAGSTIFGGNSPEKENEPSTVIYTEKSSDTYNYLHLDKKIEDLLEKIEGAGKVSVLITYDSGKEIVRAEDVASSENILEEKDSQGGTRKQTQKDHQSETVYEKGADGNNHPVIIKEIYPPVKGVVVVAEGARNISVRENITRAVQVLLDVPIHKIQVLPAGR